MQKWSNTILDWFDRFGCGFFAFFYLPDRLDLSILWPFLYARISQNPTPPPPKDEKYPFFSPKYFFKHLRVSIRLSPSTQEIQLATIFMRPHISWWRVWPSPPPISAVHFRSLVIFGVFEWFWSGFRLFGYLLRLDLPIWNRFHAPVYLSPKNEPPPKS